MSGRGKMMRPRQRWSQELGPLQTGDRMTNSCSEAIEAQSAGPSEREPSSGRRNYKCICFYLIRDRTCIVTSFMAFLRCARRREQLYQVRGRRAPLKSGIPIINVGQISIITSSISEIIDIHR